MDNYHRKRILITGGAGFLGSHLSERLLKEGNEIFCLDNFFTGIKENIAHLIDNPYFELNRHDITFPLFFAVDEIYNLACPASPIHYQNDPVKTTKVNVHGTIMMLGLAKRVKSLSLETKQNPFTFSEYKITMASMIMAESVACLPSV